MGILLGVLTFILILVSLFLMLVILAQKSKDGGMGTALGGGAAEAAFGAETNTVLTKSTIYASVLFFVLAFLLYLGRIYERTHARETAGNALPTIAAPATPLSATPALPPATNAAATPTPSTNAVTPVAPAAPTSTTSTTPAPKTP
jgi:preprotein translocase subunit SecG